MGDWPVGERLKIRLPKFPATTAQPGWGKNSPCGQKTLLLIWDLPHCQSHPKEKAKRNKQKGVIILRSTTKKPRDPRDRNTQNKVCHGKPVKQHPMEAQQRTGPKGGRAGKLHALRGIQDHDGRWGRVAQWKSSRARQKNGE